MKWGQRILAKQFQQIAMRSSHYDQISCQFCYQTTPEQKVFLFCLLKQLRAIINQPSYQPEQERLYQPQRQGLARLAELTSISKVPPSRNSLLCLHIKWLRSIRRQLGVNLDSIDEICHRLANKIAERRYQLYLLELQTKNAGYTVQRLMKQHKLQLQQNKALNVPPQAIAPQLQDQLKVDSRPLPTAIAINATDLNLQSQKSAEAQVAAQANSGTNPLQLQQQPL